jgi:lambda family phage portal protein
MNSDNGILMADGTAYEPEYGFEGGAIGGRRLGYWGLNSSGPNALIRCSLQALRSRCHALIRSNPIISGTFDSLVSDVVGSGLIPSFKMFDNDEELKEEWNEWVLDCDYDGVNDFYGLQSLVFRSMVTSGECFVLYYTGKNPYGEYILKVRLIESDQVPDSLNMLLPNGNIIVMGIEFNRRGRRVAYHMYKTHPQDDERHDSLITERILASRVAHIYRPLRPGQIRGYPLIASVIVKAKDIDEAVDAELMRRKTTAMFGGFIESDYNANNRKLLGSKPPGIKDPDNNMIAMEPATFVELDPGQRVTLSSPKDVSGSYNDWMSTQHGDLARGLNVLKEVLTGDYSGVTFSSVRTALQNIRRLYRTYQTQNIIHQFCRPTVTRKFEMGVKFDLLNVSEKDMSTRKYRTIRWQADAWDYIKPTEDIATKVTAIRAGLATRDTALATMPGGYDSSMIDSENAKLQDRSSELGLVYDSNAKQATQYGQLSEYEKAEAEGDKDDE